METGGIFQIFCPFLYYWEIERDAKKMNPFWFERSVQDGTWRK